MNKKWKLYIVTLIVLLMFLVFGKMADEREDKVDENKKDEVFAMNDAFSINLSKKQWMSIVDEYRRKVDSRNGYKMIRAKYATKREETAKEG